MCDESGSEEDEQDTGNLEETAQVKALPFSSAGDAYIPSAALQMPAHCVGNVLAWVV